MSRRKRTYPKEGEQKLRDTIRTLKKQVSRLRKENKLLREEINSLLKNPTAEKSKSTESFKKNSPLSWREEFLNRYKPSPGKKNKNE